MLSIKLMLGVLVGLVIFAQGASAILNFPGHDSVIVIGVTTNITDNNVAIPIELNGSNITFSDFNSPLGEEIHFSNSLGTENYSYFLEYFNKTTERLIVWVKFPHLDRGVQGYTLMFYENNTVMPPSRSDGGAVFSIFLNHTNTTGWDVNSINVSSAFVDGINVLNITEPLASDSAGFFTFPGNEILGKDVHGLTIVQRTRLEPVGGDKVQTLIGYEDLGSLFPLRIFYRRAGGDSCGGGSDETNSTYYCSGNSPLSALMYGGDAEKGKWYREYWDINYINDSTMVDVRNADYSFNSTNQTSAILPTSNGIQRIRMGSNGGDASMRMFIEYIGIANFTNPVIEITDLPVASQCGGLTNTTALNISAFREEGMNETVLADWEADFTLTDTLTGDVSSLSLSVQNETSLEICIIPSSGVFRADATIKYNASEDQSGEYSTRYYFFQSVVLSNITTNVNVFLLEESLSNEIKFLVNDIYNVGQTDVIVRARRYFISEGAYVPVDMGLTDFKGEAIMQLKLNEWYVFSIERDGRVVRTFAQKFLSDTDDITLFLSSPAGVDYFIYYDTIGAACTPNQVAAMLTCTFSDTSASMVDLTLAIEYKPLVGDYVIVCTNFTTASEGIMTCSYAGYNTTNLFYSLKGSFAGNEGTGNEGTVFTILRGYIENIVAQPFGSVGIIVMLFVLMAAVLFGIWNPVIPIVMGIFGIFIGMVLQLIVISVPGVISLAIAGGFIIYKMRS